MVVKLFSLDLIIKVIWLEESIYFIIRIFKLAKNQDKSAASNDKVDLKIQGLNLTKS